MLLEIVCIKADFQLLETLKQFPAYFSNIYPTSFTLGLPRINGDFWNDPHHSPHLEHSNPHQRYLCLPSSSIQVDQLMNAYLSSW